MKRYNCIWIGTGIAALTLAVCFSGSPAKAQADAGSPGDQTQAPTQDLQGSPQDAPPANQPAVPAKLTLPVGTVISVRTIERLSSEKNQVGDRFSASLEQPLIANGWVLARRGQIVTGRVVVAQKANHGGSSQLGVQISELTLVDGQIVPVNTQLARGSAAPRSGPPGRSASTIITTTALGAIIGGAAGGREGLAIGAGLGATAGGAVVLSTRGNPTVINSEEPLTFRLEAPLEVSTERGQVAFQPVSQADYSQGQDQDAYAQPRLKRGAYAGPAYYAPYPYWYGPGYYPLVPYVGFYGNFGGYYGPRFRGGFRR